MEAFEEFRPYLFAIAYRMLGSVSKAEDMVQETYIRAYTIAAETIQAPKAFLSKVITNLCLDYMRSAQAQRETYFGEWLPEPLITAETEEPAAAVDKVDSISTAVLVLLESLSPAERAVFLLREVFDYDYAEIAEIVERDEAACRKLFSRAKQHLDAHRPRFQHSPAQHEQLLSRFMESAQSGDLEGLVSLLTDDAVSVTDGGGKVASAVHPIVGRERIARFWIGLARQAESVSGLTVEFTTINHAPGMVARINGGVAFALNVELEDDKIRRIWIVRNPDKLKHLSK